MGQTSAFSLEARNLGLGGERRGGWPPTGTACESSGTASAGPDVRHGDAQSFCKVCGWNYDSAPETEALELADSDQLAGGRAADAEECGGLVDGEGQGVTVVMLS